MNNYKKILFFSFIFLPFFVWGHFVPKIPFVSAENDPRSFFFSKNLKVGDRNEDVRNLQKILNKNPATEISSFGFGSLDKETDFFGALTESAVIKFQELHESDVLRPLNLKSGTGFVGVATRLKLNSLLKDEANVPSKSGASVNNSLSQYSSKSSLSSLILNSSVSSERKKAVVVKNTSTSSSSSENSTVRAYSTSEYQMSPGKNLVLEGEGFTLTSNTVHLGEDNYITNLGANEEGTKISFIVPKDLPLGKYSIWVTNTKGSSKSETIKIYIVVTDSPVERPAIEKVEPAEATIDSEIVVSGKGFTAKDNNIYSMFGNIMNVSSLDGKTLKFKPSSMAQVAKMKSEESAKNMGMEVWFYVVNDNGYNKEPASFLINF